MREVNIFSSLKQVGKGQKCSVLNSIFKDSPPKNPTLWPRAGPGGKAERGVLPVAKQRQAHGPCCLGRRLSPATVGNPPQLFDQENDYNYCYI